MKRLLVKNAAFVALMNERQEVVKGASVLVNGPRIEQVGRNIRPPAGSRVLDASGCLVLPGFVNTHHHMFQSLTRNIPSAADRELFDWLTGLYEVWRNLTPEAVRVSAKAAMAELLLTGCTTTADHFYLFPKGQPKDLIDHEIRAAREMGIRFHPCRGAMSLGRSKGGLPPDAVVQKDDEILADCERLVKKHHDPSRFSMCRLAVGPCALFNVTRELMAGSAEFARRNGLRLHTHLAETKDEERFCLERFGMRPVEYLDSLEWLGRDVWLAHCVHLNDAEIRKLARTRTSVAHCPVSNMRLGSGIAPARKMIDAGVTVGLAVDGSASNDSSDMWGELRQCLLVHRLPFSSGWVEPYEVMLAATVGGAECLGRDDIGMIAPGMAADLILIDLEKIGFAGALADPVSAVLFCGDSHVVDTVIVNGVVRVRNGKLVDVDEGKLFADAERVSRKLFGGRPQRAIGRNMRIVLDRHGAR